MKLSDLRYDEKDFLDDLKTMELTDLEKDEVIRCITYDPRPNSYYRQVQTALYGDIEKTPFQETFDDICQDLENANWKDAEDKLDKAIGQAESVLEPDPLPAFNSEIESELFTLLTKCKFGTDYCQDIRELSWLQYLRSVLYEKTNLLPMAVKAINNALSCNPVSAEFSIRATKLYYMSGKLTGFNPLDDCLAVVNNAETYYQYIDLVCFVYDVVMGNPDKAREIAKWFADRTRSPKVNLRAVNKTKLALTATEGVNFRVDTLHFAPVSACQLNHRSNKGVFQYTEMVLLDFFD